MDGGCCPLCRHVQTLSHMLNRCLVLVDILTQVLMVISDFLSEHLLAWYHFECQLPNSTYSTATFGLPVPLSFDQTSVYVVHKAQIWIIRGLPGTIHGSPIQTMHT